MAASTAAPSVGLVEVRTISGDARWLVIRHPPSARLPSEDYAPRKIILACSDCKNRNYFTTKNKRVHPERVEWKKYCPRCDKHVLHKETK